MTKIVSSSAWRTVRTQLLHDEEEAFRVLDALNIKRQQLPMVEIQDPSRFKFDAIDGSKASLIDLFGGRKQLILYNFMLYDNREEPCVWCSFNMDNIPTHLEHLHSRETSFAITAPASKERIKETRDRFGWTLPFYGCKTTVADAGADAEEMAWKTGTDWVGYSVFYREDDKVYFTYSANDRGTEPPMTTIALLDMTVLGRQENGDGHFPLRV